MDRIAKFEKVSEEQFINAIKDDFKDKSIGELQEIYRSIQLPWRGTKGSAGYDFRIPFSCILRPGETIKVPTGIRARMQESWVLMIFPRSGLGFKYRLQLNNTVGVIDSDYYYSDNEGHIFIKVTNDSNEGKVLELNAGDGFAQGIFLPFGITEDDECEAERNGGFGSTGK